MRAQQLADQTSTLIPFNSASLQSLQRQLGKGSDVGSSIYGGTSDNGKWNWLVRGQVLEVIGTSSGQRLASFCFQSEKRCTITSVKEYCIPGSSRLLVGLDVQNGGMLCLVDVITSQILTQVSFPYKVTAIEPVTYAGGVKAPNFALSDHLRCFFGIVAVGTEGGHIYLVDMHLDVEYDSLADSKKILVITPASAKTPELRRKVLRTGDHLCLELGGDHHKNRAFNFSKPSGEILKAFQASGVCVSAITYVPKLGSLFVGFDFGCFQIWRLAAPILEFSSPLTQVVSPVTHFAYLEPDDDPENFSYMMAARGPMLTDISPDVVTDVHLFQLAYERKQFYPGHGYMYHEFFNCEARFEFALTADNANPDSATSIGSRMISCFTIQKRKTRGEDAYHDEEEDESDLGLCVFCWEAALTVDEGTSNPLCFLALFDLNRWYHAQMPANVRYIQRPDVCPYVAFCSLESVMEASCPDVLLNTYVDTSLMSRFVSSQAPAPEQHFYPSSLSFSVCCLMETGLVKTSFKGHQRQVLHDILKQGPSCLRAPQALYNHSVAVGLIIPKHDHPVGSVPVAVQREALLTMCLEYNLVSFIVTCISSWATGDYVTALTLRTILDWAWQTVARIKETIDEKCMFLYNGYGNYVEDLVIRLLDKLAVQLNHIITIFQALIEQSVQITEQGQADLETKLNVVMLISNHLQAVIWFIRVGLLPECPDDGQPVIEGQFSYPANRLREAFDQRRQELQAMTRSGGDSDILMIDGIIEELGDHVVHLWNREDKDGNGKYPPPSIHALLDIYLLENVPLMTKHCIVAYFLQGLEICLDPNKHEEILDKIGQFEQTFCIPPGVARLLRGFFLLDHKLFEDAITTFLDPLITVDLPSWQHQRIMKAFLYHDNSKKALHYQRTRNPPLNTLEDVQMHLTVLLANGLTSEAFQFQRKYNDPASAQDLLLHLFLGCQQTHTMDNLLKLHFTDEEETMLIRYLETSTEPNSQELLVMHYLQRGRYVEAIQLNERLKQRNIMTGSDLKSKEHHATRNAIVESYAKLLPSVQRKLAFSPEASHKRATVIKREVQRPKPLSTVVNPAKASQVISHSSLINSVLDKIAEAREQIKEQDTPFKNRTEELVDITCNMPFVTTPMVSHSKSRLSQGTAETIYPTNIEDMMDETLPGAGAFSPRKSFSPIIKSSIPNFLMQDTINRLNYTGADRLSLLQTPPIKKRSPGHLRRPRMPTQQTPQSILKVQEKSKHPALRTIGGTQTEMSDSVRATAINKMPPPIFSMHDDQQSAPTPQTSLPKHIRFSTVTERSPSPDDMDQSDTRVSIEVEGSATPEFLTPEKVDKEEEDEDARFSTPEQEVRKSLIMQTPEQEEVLEDIKLQTPEEVMEDVKERGVKDESIDTEITFTIDVRPSKEVDHPHAEEMEQDTPVDQQTDASACGALPAVPLAHFPIKSMAQSPNSPVLTSPLQFGNTTPPSVKRSPLSEILVSKHLEMFDEKMDVVPPSPSRSALTPPASAESSPMTAAMSKSVSFAPTSGLLKKDKAVHSQTFAEISIQTTPGLLLRQESSTTKKPSFTASLTTSPEAAVEQDDRIDLGLPTSPIDIDSTSPVKQEPGSPEIPIPELDSPTWSASSSKLPTIKQEPVKKEGSPKQHIGTPSFIFSPPQTRSWAKRSARKTLTKVAAPSPAPAMTPGLLTNLSTPASSGVRQLRTGSGSTRRTIGGRTSAYAGGSSNDTPADVKTPAPTPQMIAVRQAIATRSRGYKKDVDISVTKRNTRARKSPVQSLDNYPIVLISPLKYEDEKPVTRSNPRKVVHSHKMTLRTPKERKRHVKLW
ncbi:protein ELYS-like [Antedon mediterranea]|uniref:protein ELYS-like n=1 Tax=Antedon mediterranea TaxID=105859 RepID=UPI003AF9B4BB